MENEKDLDWEQKGKEAEALVENMAREADKISWAEAQIRGLPNKRSVFDDYNDDYMIWGDKASINKLQKEMDKEAEAKAVHAAELKIKTKAILDSAAARLKNFPQQVVNKAEIESDTMKVTIVPQSVVFDRKRYSVSETKMDGIGRQYVILTNFQTGVKTKAIFDRRPGGYRKTSSYQQSEEASQIYDHRGASSFKAAKESIENKARNEASMEDFRKVDPARRDRIEDELMDFFNIDNEKKSPIDIWATRPGTTNKIL